MKTAMVLAVLAGCSSLPIDYSKTIPAPTGSEEAIRMVTADWSMSERPEVFWYGPDALDCDIGYGPHTGYTSVANGECVGGEQEGNQILVGVADGWTVWQTFFAHEMAHRASELRGEGGDHDHVGHFFRYADGRELLIESVEGLGGDQDVERNKLALLEMQRISSP